ncbi:cytochrome b/b6 domain-containing protein, partial [Corynebacterium sp. UBA2622]|uniref:cytochrome b/b6 domain-containing protein n=1 Tax=Corynebacterium sp. UBA2622 TaxID=1946393 RepID=UPI0025B9B72E
PRHPGGQPFPPAVAALIEAPVPSESPGTAEQRDAAPGDFAEVPLRRGLPRHPGGQPFPPAATALVKAPVLPAVTLAEPTPPESARPEPAESHPTQPKPVREAPAPAAVSRVAAGRGADTRGVRRFSAAQWGFGLVSLGFIFGLTVLLARTFVSTAVGADFVARYDGTQPLPAGAPVGLPGWLNWAHFFNMFLLALVVKTGIGVRTEKRPAAYWARRGEPRSKISLTLWLHLMLDLAWLTLGAIFYVLLFTTGQWVRIVPTSWDVIPQAASAGVQYLTLDWPMENGWVHYNALQELSYFAVVFVASPLAVFSGLRMSPWWPKRFSAVPLKVARSLHFPTMVFFVAFIAVHVALVALTGLRRNLNAMFAARGDIDPSVYGGDWTGTWVFLGALAIIALAWWAARPAVVAPLARLTGNVSNR